MCDILTYRYAAKGVLDIDATDPEEADAQLNAMTPVEVLTHFSLDCFDIVDKEEEKEAQRQEMERRKTEKELIESSGYPILHRDPYARFRYDGKRRDVILAELRMNLVRGFEIREGDEVRQLKDAPMKSYDRNVVGWFDRFPLSDAVEQYPDLLAV